MHKARSEEKPWLRRRHLVVDKKWQRYVGIRLTAATIAVTALAQLVTLYLTSGTALEEMSSDQWQLATVLVTCLQPLVLFAVLWKTAMRLAHKFAGPARVLENAVDNLCVGRFDSRLELRDGDYLEGLAAALQRLTMQLEEQASRQGATNTTPQPAARQQLLPLRPLDPEVQHG